MGESSKLGLIPEKKQSTKTSSQSQDASSSSSTRTKRKQESSPSRQIIQHKLRSFLVDVREGKEFGDGHGFDGVSSGVGEQEGDAEREEGVDGVLVGEEDESFDVVPVDGESEVWVEVVY